MDCKYTIDKSSGAHDFYWIYIVHTILPSFTLPPTAQPTKIKIKNIEKKFKTVRRADKKKILVGCQMYRRIRRIEIQNPICVVHWMSQQITDR
jgi:hypothetical protein